MSPFTSLLSACALLLATDHVAAQQPTGLPEGITREQMWYAPTSEDWAKPVQIRWQRTWEDAVAVSLETGRPILACVNMDGEIASEHYAGIRYRDPEIGKLYEPYICVIASVYRHNPSDTDEQGHRVECPRFHGVTCGEHIAMEPIIFDQFLDGRRVAPRHIMVELDGSEVYDVYYAFDTDSVFRAIREGIEQRERQPNPPRGDRSLLDKVASRDAADRAEVEAAYQAADPDLKKALLDAALANPAAEQLGLLRMALFDLDENLNKLARAGLANSSSEGSIDLILEALRGALPEDEREQLVAALARIGEKSVRARTLAQVQQGLGDSSSAIDVQAWQGAYEGATYAAVPSAEQLEEQLEQVDEQLLSSPTDPATQLESAVASLAFAVSPDTAARLARQPATAARYARAYYLDAREQAEAARELGVTDWQVDAIDSIASFALEERTRAYAAAERAVAAIPRGDTSWNSMAVLDIFADARRRAISEAVTAKQAWDPSWMSDLHATYSILAQHPLGNLVQVLTHYDFLASLGAYKQAAAALRQALERYPSSWDLHARFRAQVERQGGVRALESSYQRWLARDNAPAHLSWFAGYASIQAAEAWRKANQPKEALASYGRAIGHYQTAMREDAATTQSSQTYLALVHAGRARIALEAQQLETAMQELLAAFEADPSASAKLDGLNFSAYVTSVTLRARLLEAGQDELAQTLLDAVNALPFEARQRPAYDTPGAPSADATRFGGGGGR